jgi:hypothetical protein
MSMGKKLAIGALSFVPLVLLGYALWAYLEDGHLSQRVVWVATLSGVVDSGLGAFYIPHVHDNPRVGKDWKIAWIAALGIPYITVAPIYWFVYVLPEKPRPAEPAGASPGGAWYPDPWGEAPFRWWDGEGWTAWVTGPPAG